MTDDYEYFKRQIQLMTGIDLSSYKENQMKRRLDSLLVRNKLKSYQDYVSVLRNDKAKLDEFISYMTINVSEFWRNGEQWDVLDLYILPKLLKPEGIKVWHPPRL